MDEADASTAISNLITAYAETVVEMEDMAATLTLGMGKMMKPGWFVVVVPAVDERAFYLTIMAPPVDGVQHEYPSITRMDMDALPTDTLDNFKIYVSTVLESACRDVEQRMAGQAARSQLVLPKGVKRGDWYEADGSGRGPLAEQTRQDRRPTAQAATARRQNELSARARHRLAQEREEAEVLESIARAIEPESGHEG